MRFQIRLQVHIVMDLLRAALNRVGLQVVLVFHFFENCPPIHLAILLPVVRAQAWVSASETFVTKESLTEIVVKVLGATATSIRIYH